MTRPKFIGHPSVRLLARLFCIVVLVNCFTVRGYAQNYYVAVNGNDSSGDGSAANPWASVQRALTVLHDSGVDGAMVLVRPGTYGQQRLVGTFARGVTVRSEVPYQAVLRANTRAMIAYGNSRGVSGITVEGFDMAHTGAGAEALVFQVDGFGGEQNVNRLTIRNNILHDSWNNDILKIGNGAREVIVEGNMFYNQTGSDEHVDVNSVENITIRDNVFFNDFAGSGRTNGNNTSSYIVIKDSNDDSDIYVGTDNVTVERNVFLNWEGGAGSNFVLVGEDGKPYIEARNVMVQNNLMLGNSANVMRAPFGVKSGEDITFRHNTVVGDLPSLAFAMRMNVENAAVTNDRVNFYNNIYSDPTGTMGAENASAANDFSDTPPADIDEWQLLNNQYWNGAAAIPASGAEAINYTSDANRVVANPGLPLHAGLVIPRWNPMAGEFAGGSATIRDVFEQLVKRYGRPDPGSAGVDQALPTQSPAEDILGNQRGESPDIGAFEWVAGLSADFNGDGIVDAEDLAKWRDDFGPNDGSDADGDGDSDGADFLDWQQELSVAVALAISPVIVPEPSMSTSLMLGLVLIRLAYR
jgi:hypothetical protein